MSSLSRNTLLCRLREVHATHILSAAATAARYALDEYHLPTDGTHEEVMLRAFNTIAEIHAGCENTDRLPADQVRLAALLTKTLQILFPERGESNCLEELLGDHRFSPRRVVELRP